MLARPALDRDLHRAPSRRGKKPVVHTCACGDHAWTPLTRGFVALFDTEFAPAIGLWNWFAHQGKPTMYAARTQWVMIDGKQRPVTVRMHHVVCPPSQGLSVDHLNCNSLDNRRSNLRLCTTFQNAVNRKKRRGCKSKYIGVSPNKNRWRAHILIDGNRHYLGSFATQEDAAVAYDRAVRNNRKEIYVLNFPDDDVARALAESGYMPIDRYVNRKVTP